MNILQIIQETKKECAEQAAAARAKAEALKTAEMEKKAAKEAADAVLKNKQADMLGELKDALTVIEDLSGRRDYSDARLTTEQYLSIPPSYMKNIGFHENSNKWEPKVIVCDNTGYRRVFLAALDVAIEDKALVVSFKASCDLTRRYETTEEAVRDFVKTLVEKGLLESHP